MREKNIFFYIAILDSLQDGVCVYNEQGDFVYVNDSVVNIRGIPRQEYLKMNVHDLFETRYIDICVFDRVMESRQEFSVQQRYYLRGRSMKPRLATGSPIFDENGYVKYVVVVLRDIQAYEQQHRKVLEENRIVNSTVERGSQVVEPIAEGPKMKALLAVARNVATLDSTIILCGESGTGKEVMAHYIHNRSRRSQNAMIEVNCAALPENLLEAEQIEKKKKQ